jgi:hypothetical protein
MQVDGDTVTIDRTAPDIVRTIIADGQTITIDTTREGVRTLTVDGTEITIDRTEESNLESFIQQFTGAAAAYSLRDLAGSGNTTVVRVRRSSDNAEADFKASEVSDGTLVDWVNEIGVIRNRTGSAKWAAVTPTATGFDASTATASACGYDLYGSSGDSVTVTFDVLLNSGSFSVQLRNGFESGSSVCTPEVISTSGSKSFTLTSSADFVALQFISVSADIEITNFSINTPWTNDGFVETWYDQSGNGNDATQQVSGSQPKIVDGGVLVSGGILSDGAGTYLELNSTLSISDEFDIFFTGTATASNWTSLQRSPYGFYTNADYPRFNDDSFRYTIAGSDSGSTNYNSGFTIGASTPFLFNFNRNAADSVGAQINGTAQTNRVTLTGTHQINQLFRRGANTSQVWDGTMSEMIFYPSDQSANRVAIETNINNQYDIY